MLPEDRDRAYLWDMLDAARTARTFLVGIPFHAFEEDRKLQLAIERLVEIVGEAARRVSATFASEHPEFPWKQMIAQRNVLAHEYGEIKLERIYALVTTDLTKLIQQLEALSLEP